MITGKETTDIISRLVERAARVTEEGTFSDRNPVLGRMIRCQFCKKRRRQNAEIPCCTGIKYTPTKVGEVIEMRDGQKYKADPHGAWRKI